LSPCPHPARAGALSNKNVAVRHSFYDESHSL
jgi:hypothetical protein